MPSPGNGPDLTSFPTGEGRQRRLTTQKNYAGQKLWWGKGSGKEEKLVKLNEKVGWIQPTIYNNLAMP